MKIRVSNLFFFINFTHRIVKIGRDLCESPGPTFCSKCVHWEQAAQCLVCLSFENLQGWRVHSVSGQPVLVSDQPHGQFLLILSQNFHCSRLCLLPLVLSLCTSREHLVSSSLHPPLIAVGSFFVLMNKSSFLSFSSCALCYSFVFLVLRSTELDMMLHVWSHNCPIAEKNYFPQPVDYSQVFGWPSVHTVDSCSQNGFLVSQLGPCNCCLGLFHSRYKTLHMPLLNIMTF